MQGLLNNFITQRKANILQGFGVNIVKSNMNDLNKAHGEGSKGGHVIGHTKNGKPIYDTSTKEKFKSSLEKIHGEVKETKTTSKSGDIYDYHNKNKEKVAQYHPEGEHTYVKLENGMQKIEHPEKIKEKLKQHLNKDQDHFYSVVSKHYEPGDDGESEHTMLENLSKHKNVDKILSQLNKKKK